MKLFLPAIWACLGFLVIGCDAPEARPNEASTAPISAVLAEKAYLQKCSLCHGRDGKLGVAKATDLSSSAMSIEERVAIIRYGKGLMPPQNDVLDDATILGLAQYLSDFREDA